MKSTTKQTVNRYKKFLKSFKKGYYTSLVEAATDASINHNVATAAVNLKFVKKDKSTGVYKLRRKKVSKIDAELLLECTNELNYSLR